MNAHAVPRLLARALVVSFLASVTACAPALPTVAASPASADTADRESIRMAIAGVAHHIDDKRWTELRALYSDTVRTDYTSLFGGSPQTQTGDALIGAWRKLLTPIVTQHLLGPIQVEITGSSATARCHVRGYHRAPGTSGGDEWLVAGHYSFELVKQATAWKIREMKLQTFYQTGNAQLLALAGGK